MKGAYYATISPRENYLASSPLFTNTIQLWSIEKRKVVKTLDGHEKGVYNVAFSNNERMLVSIGWDGSVILWDLQQEKVVDKQSIEKAVLKSLQSDAKAELIVQLNQENRLASVRLKQP